MFRLLTRLRRVAQKGNTDLNNRPNCLNPKKAGSPEVIQPLNKLNREGLTPAAQAESRCSQNPQKTRARLRNLLQLETVDSKEHLVNQIIT